MLDLQWAIRQNYCEIAAGSSLECNVYIICTPRKTSHAGAIKQGPCAVQNVPRTSTKQPFKIVSWKRDYLLLFILSTNQLQIMKWILCHAASQGLFYLLNQCSALLFSCRFNVLAVHVLRVRFCNSYVGTNDQTTPLRKTKLEDTGEKPFSQITGIIDNQKRL